jgi:hypothetical protein
MALEEFDYSSVHFVSEQEREYFAEAHLGETVRSFLVSSTGRFLHGRAKGVIAEGKDKLADLDPTTPEGVAEWKAIKQDMANAESFMQWCAEAIVNGDNAASQLEEYRE